MISVAQYHLIRQLKEREGLSQRQIAKELGISRNTVMKYLREREMPSTIKRQQSYGHKNYSLETQRILPIIDHWLEEDQKRWNKQTHTASRIFQRLVDEYHFKGSASNIRKIVAKRKQQLKEVFIPLQFQLGQQFQFDWGEADVYIQGKLQRVYLFCIQLAASRMTFVRAYLHEKQEAFLDGFVHAFQFFGGVPAEGLFDNLKTAVIKVLSGRERLEQEAFQALQAHYLFKAQFCNVRSGNEKGRIEGIVGNIRRNALVPEPHVQTLDELNQLLESWCIKHAETTKVPHSIDTIATMWEKEKDHLHSLPLSPFEACKIRSCRVSKTSMVTIETNQYSVPCQYVGQVVWVKLFVDEVIIVAQNQVIATHPRSYERNQMLPMLDHYLDVLLEKPRALHDAHAMQTPDVPDVIRRFHKEMHQRFGAEGDRSFVRLLLLHRDVGMDNLTHALLLAEQTGVYRYEVVHDFLLKLTDEVAPQHSLSQERSPVDLQSFRIQKTNIQRYDQLIGGAKDDNRTATGTLH